MEVALLSSEPQDVYRMLSGQQEVEGRAFLLIAHLLVIPLTAVPFPVSDLQTISQIIISHFSVLSCTF